MNINFISTALLVIFSITISSCITNFDYNEASRFDNISEGQSTDKVKEVLGDPDKLDTFKTAEGFAEVWIYYHDYLTPCSSGCERYYYAPILYLVIENDLVVNVFNVGSKE